jgi:hypothetical protein
MQRRSLLLGAAAAFCPALLPAASPLGSLVYVQRDGLWIRQLTAAKPMRLIAARNLEQPRFSASGNWVSCEDGDRLHVISPDGQVHRTVTELAFSGWPAAQWSPVRDELIAIRDDGLLLYIPAKDRSVPIQNTRVGGTRVVFNAEGNEIIYGGVDGYVSPPLVSTERTGQLCRVRIDEPNARPVVLVSEHMKGFIPCAWSPSINAALYWLDESFSASLMADGLTLFRIPASGGEPKALDTTLVHGDFVALSPDQSRLALTVGAAREEWTGKRIAILDLKTNKLSYITPPEIAAVCPAWSPDGRHIAFSAAPVPPENIGGGDPARQALQKRRIWITSAAGSSKPRQITHNPRYRDEEPVWLGDGTHILLCRIDQADRRTMWLLDLNRPDPIQVAGPLPTLQNDDAWFGYYGYIEWRRLFDWHM